VTERFHDDPHIHTLGEGQCGGRVAKIMKPDRRQLRGRQDGVEFARRVARLERAADRGREDEAGVFPRAASG